MRVDDRLDDVSQQLQALLEDYGIRQVLASYAKPLVFIDADTSPAQLINVVAATAPAFVTLTVTIFDPDDFAQSLDAELGEHGRQISSAGHALIAEHRDRTGRVQDISLQWIGCAAVYAYFDAADWVSTLQDEVEDSAVERDEPSDLARSRARAHQLVTTLEADPTFRAAAPSKRRARGDRLLDGFLDADDYHLPQLGSIVEAAVRLAADHAADAIAALDLEGIAAMPRWRAARTQQARTDLAEQLLLERTGYASNRNTADAFRRRVDAAHPR